MQYNTAAYAYGKVQFNKGAHTNVLQMHVNTCILALLMHTDAKHLWVNI